MARLKAQSTIKTVNCHGRCAVSLSFSSLPVAFRDLKTKHFFPTVPIGLAHSDGSSLRNSHQSIAVSARLGRDLVARTNDTASPDAGKGSVRRIPAFRIPIVLRFRTPTTSSLWQWHWPRFPAKTFGIPLGEQRFGRAEACAFVFAMSTEPVLPHHQQFDYHRWQHYKNYKKYNLSMQCLALDSFTIYHNNT